MKRIRSSFVAGGASALLPDDEREPAKSTGAAGYSSRGVMRKIETTSA
jgi:hypothetical protein